MEPMGRVVSCRSHAALGVPAQTLRAAHCLDTTAQRAPPKTLKPKPC